MRSHLSTCACPYVVAARSEEPRHGSIELAAPHCGEIRKAMGTKTRSSAACMEAGKAKRPQHDRSRGACRPSSQANRRKKSRPDDGVKRASGSTRSLLGHAVAACNTERLAGWTSDHDRRSRFDPRGPKFARAPHADRTAIRRRDGRLQLRHETKERMLAIGPYLSNTGLP